ncbi:type VII secretion system-associated protein [Nocardia sp. Marseille-Q1738]
MDQSESGTIRMGDWFILTSPAWEPNESEQSPPARTIVGRWEIGTDGRVGPFEPNPAYLPPDEWSPTDPLDALLHLIGAGDADAAAELVPTLRQSVVEIGCDEHGRPVVETAPDEVPCVVVVTAEVQKFGSPVHRWLPVVGDELPAVVPLGVDILLNANGRAAFRLRAEALRRHGSATQD